jgi:hypothetical protein
MFFSNDTLRNWQSGGRLAHPSAFECLPSNDESLPAAVAQITTNDAPKNNGPALLTASNEAIGLSPPASWLYSELSKDYNAAHSSTKSVVLEEEHVFDSLGPSREYQSLCGSE